MAKWIPAYPVDFTPEGDRTNQAIQKHITEIARIYDMIHVLRQNFVGAGFPSSPERNQLFINPNTLEAFTYVGLSGENDWRTIVTQSKSEPMRSFSSCPASRHQRTTGRTFPSTHRAVWSCRTPTSSTGTMPTFTPQVQ